MFSSDSFVLVLNVNFSYFFFASQSKVTSVMKGFILNYSVQRGLISPPPFLVTTPFIEKSYPQPNGPGNLPQNITLNVKNLNTLY